VDTRKLVSTAVNRNVNVKTSSDAGKKKVSEAVTEERASRLFVSTKLLATKSSRKNQTVVDENEHARERDAANRQQSNEDNTATSLR
jgi:hypothetical protein